MADYAMKLFNNIFPNPRSTYKYTSLQRDEIRTLVIQPGSSYSPLVGTLEQCQQGDPEKPYEALSYTWGKLNRRKSLRIGKHRIAVTRNAEALLRRIRHTSNPRRVWIDSICINQKDVEERNHQVSKMYSIYSEASRVVVFVGESDHNTKNVISFFNRLDELYRTQDQPEGTTSPGDQREKANQARNNIDKALKESGCGDYSIIRAFTERPWFQRAWTFQEACASTRCVMLCGEHQLEWRAFISAALYIDSGRMLGIFGRTADTVVALAYFSAANPSRPALRSSAILHFIRHLGAREDRDKVYAFATMIDRTGLPPFTVSYDLPVSEVYTQITRDTISQERGLSVLSGIHGPNRNKTSGLPSWVPGWVLPRPTAYLCGFDWPSPSHHYEMNKGAPFSNSLQYLGSNKRHLSLRGAQMDVIKRTYEPTAILAHIARLEALGSEVWNIKGKWNRLLNTVIHRLCEELDLCDIAGHLSAYKDYDQTGRSALEALLLTLTADRGAVSEEEAGPIYYYQSRSVRLVYIGHRLWDESEESYARMEVAVSLMKTFLEARTIFVTSNGLLGIAGLSAQVGDELWNVVGGEVPYILRRASAGKSERFTVVSEAYAHGIMKGELWDGQVRPVTGGHLNFQDIVIV